MVTYVQPLEEYGVTKHSLDFIKKHADRVGELLAVSLIRKVDGIPVSIFICREGNIVVFGLNWGYAGEGPHGLHTAINEIFGKNFPMSEITEMNMEWCYTVLFDEDGYRIIGQKPIEVISGLIS